MEELEQFLERKVEVRANFVERHLEPNNQNFNTFIKDFETFAKALIKAKKTGNYKPVLNKKAKIRESIKENTRPNDDMEKNKNVYNNNSDLLKVKTEKLSVVASIHTNTDPDEMPAPKRLPPKRKVKKENESINVKATRGRDNSESKRSTRSNAVKPERNSDVILQTTPIPFIDLSEFIGLSEDESQPEPVRSTRTRTKKAEPSEASAPTTVRSTRTKTRNKLQLENESITAFANMNETETVSTSRNEVEGSWKLEDVGSKTIDLIKGIDVSDQPVRITRTKTKTKVKRERSQSEEQGNRHNNHKRSKSNTRSDNEEAHNLSGRTEYEDAVSEIETCKNSTIIVRSEATEEPRNEVNHRQILNETVILDRQNTAQPVSGNHVSDILTDDESLEEVQPVSPQKGKKAKEVFSPYVRSPVKKKVEAFEKFNQHDGTEVSSKANTSRVLREIEENKGNVKEKAKGFTPVSAKTLYKNGPSSTSKISKYIGSKSNYLNDSMSLLAKSTPIKGPAPFPSKSASVDYREKEAKRLEREREAKRQEQAKLAAYAEKKKRYEEKVEKKKEAIEKEKLKALEMQRLKEERYKLLLQQKEEKQKQIKEEHEKKRLLAKQRAEEKRKEEEYQRMLAHQEKLKHEQLMKKKAEAEDLRKKALQNSTTPIYMTTPAPYLQCADCYDSDDEEYNSKRMIPDWASKHRKFEVDKTQTTLGHRIKNTFFCCQNHTVDLRDIFIQIDPRKLKRTSSANWKKPPRFTMLPDCQ